MESNWVKTRMGWKSEFGASSPHTQCSVNGFLGPLKGLPLIWLRQAVRAITPNWIKFIVEKGHRSIDLEKSTLKSTRTLAISRQLDMGTWVFKITEYKQVVRQNCWACLLLTVESEHLQSWSTQFRPSGALFKNAVTSSEYWMCERIASVISASFDELGSHRRCPRCWLSFSWDLLMRIAGNLFDRIFSI